MSMINISHLEKLYIENKGYIDSLNHEELVRLSNSFLYRTILENTFYDVIKKGSITTDDYYSIISNIKVMEIIDIYLKSKNIEIIETYEINKDEIEREFLDKPSIFNYYKSVPKKLLSPFEEKRLFILLNIERNKYNQIKDKLFKVKEPLIKELAVATNNGLDLKYKYDFLKEQFYKLLNLYNSSDDFDNYIYEELVKNSSSIKINNNLNKKINEDLLQDYLDQRKKIRLIISKIASSNLRLVFWKLKTMNTFFMDENIEDKIQDGNEGLMKAIERFDVTRNIKFSNYASYWIKQCILYNQNNYNQRVRIPDYIVALSKKVNETVDNYIKEIGEVPSSKEVSDILNVSHTSVEKIMSFNVNSISIDNAVDNDEDSPLLGSLVDNEESKVEDEIICNELNNSIYNELFKIKQKERFIIMLRMGIKFKEPEFIKMKYGKLLVSSSPMSNDEIKNKTSISFSLDKDLNDGNVHVINDEVYYYYFDGNSKNLKEVAKIIKMTHQRVSQIEKNGIDSLKKPCHKKVLKDFYE